MTFNDPEKEAFSPFPMIISETLFTILATFNLPSANALNLVQSKKLLFGKELILYLICQFSGLPISAANKDMMSKVWTNGDKII